MRYEVSVRVDDVAAAHHLEGYPGDCRRLHGHNWSFAASVGADALHGDMVVDFRVLKDVFRALDHTFLDEDPEICADGHRPTTERVATVVAARIQRVLDALPNRPRLLRIAVRETSRNTVVFTP
jgi:6-pyruvoyltetrahydropterin/6-carboxytetrahydropterin synthase